MQILLTMTTTSDINKGINIVTDDNLQRYQHDGFPPVEFNDSPCV